MKNISKRLIRKYGIEEEKKKVLKELIGLEMNLIKDITKGNVSRLKILEERVDVELELNMIDLIYDFSDRDIEGMWELKKKKIIEKYLSEEE